MSWIGFRGCDENKDFKVSIKRKHGDSRIILGEQMAEREARACYKEFKKILDDKKVWVECTDTDGVQWCIPKEEIGFLKIGE